jgi:hypothetical protein
MRAVLALWIVCAAVIAWVWLRPFGDAPLPQPVEHAPRARKKTVANRPGAGAAAVPVAAPEDEPVADDPAAAPVQAGPPEMLNRHDLENGIDRVRDKVMHCREVEQFVGLMTVKLVIARNGSVQAALVQPPLEHTRTAECVRHALHGLSFPRFRGTYLPTIEWTYPFLFKEG